jgi:hypothetical protein
MLDTHLKRKPEAEQLYRRALECEPRHAYALYNLAVLLEELYFNANKVPQNEGAEIIDHMKEVHKEEVLSYYKRAVDADPKDSATLADYGRYVTAGVDVCG